jgi:hypothetical protein
VEIRHTFPGTALKNLDGSIAGPFGKVGAEVSEEQAYQCARLATLSILGNLKRKLGSLDRVTAWLVIDGFVNVELGFVKTTAVINSCSELIPYRKLTTTSLPLPV